MTGNIQHLMLDIVFLDSKVMNSSRIGVFDSGLGGLTVWREIRRQMPNEDILYFADSKNCPYGPKPPQTIAKLACEIVDGMIASGCSAGFRFGAGKNFVEERQQPAIGCIHNGVHFQRGYAAGGGR